MKTEIIASWKLVTVKGRDMYVITTVSGQTIWVLKTQFDTNSETITYDTLKAGSQYKSKDIDPTTNLPVMKTLTADRNEFKGCGKQIVRKYSAVEMLDHLAAKGITPTFALS